MTRRYRSRTSRPSFLLLDFAQTILLDDPSPMESAFEILSERGIVRERFELGQLVHEANALFSARTRPGTRYESYMSFWDVVVELLVGQTTTSPTELAAALKDGVRAAQERSAGRQVIEKEALARIAAIPLPMGILSNGAASLPQQCATLGIAGYFQVILASEAIGLEKPDSASFLYAAGSVGLAPSRILYVGDNYDLDYLGARQAGLESLLVDPRGWYEGFNADTIPSLGALVGYLHETRD